MYEHFDQDITKMIRFFRYWGILASALVASGIIALVLFILANALPACGHDLFFGETSLIDAVLGGKEVWSGLWTPFWGTLKLVFLTALFAIPSGLCIGIYMSEYANAKNEYIIRTILDTLAGLPSILAGLFGFVLILFSHKFFAANTCLLLAAFCLGILALPLPAINIFNALKVVPQQLRMTAASLGFNKEQAIFRLLIPAVAGPIFSGILMTCGRSAEDTAVILMTGAVASSSVQGIFGKFEALPFFIYYMSANYQNEQQLSQVFVAAGLLLFISVLFLGLGNLLQKVR